MLGYRMFFSVPEHQVSDVTALAREQLHAWLRDKRYAADSLLPDRTVPLAENVDGLLLERREQDGSVATRARIVENMATGRWTTELTIHVPGSPAKNPWILLDIDHIENAADSPAPTKWVATPRLAKRLLGVMPALDGSAVLADKPRLVSGNDVEALVDVVCDPDRRGLIFVAGSDSGMPIQPWADLVAGLLKDTIGLAAAYILDPDATASLSEALGDSHAIRPGTVRTFLPGADPASELDALRHRVLTTQRIIRGDGTRVARLLGWKARETTLEHPLPKSAIRTSRAFEHQLDSILVDRLTVAEPAVAVTGENGTALDHPDDLRESAYNHALAAPDEVAAQASQYLALRDLSLTVLGTEDVSEAALDEITRLAQLGRQASETQAAVSQRLEDLQFRLAGAEEARQEVARRLEDEQLEHAQTAQSESDASDLVRHLRKLLIQAGGADHAWSPVPEVSRLARPQSFDDLLEMLSELSDVIFTGNAEITSGLDEGDPMGRWAGKAWDALMALSDYAKASREGKCDRDVDGYLRHTPDGFRTFPANRHARDESADVQNNPRFRSARIFPVPVEVDSAGCAFMGAHFKLAQSGMLSPRLHYLDRTANSDSVYVGYIGPHLPTKQTN